MASCRRRSRRAAPEHAGRAARWAARGARRERRCRSRARPGAAGGRPGRLHRLRRRALLRALPQRPRPLPGVPLLHYVAPRSLLVFDHVSRGIALLHAGSDAERAALRREVIAALRGPYPRDRACRRLRGAEGSARPRGVHRSGVQRVQEYIAAGDVYQLVLSSRFAGQHELDPFQVYRALRLINPSPYMYFCRLGALTVVGSSPEALVKLSARAGATAADRRHAPAPRRSSARCAARGRAARGCQGECRARDAGRPGPQRPRSRGRAPAACGSSRIAPSSATAT